MVPEPHRITRRPDLSFDSMRIVAISMRMGGHAAVSGYDRLIDYLPCERIAPPATWSFMQRATARALRPLIRSAGSQWYHRESMIAELEAAARWLRGHGGAFHFLYGENSYRYLALMKHFRRHPVVATYHLPADKFHRIVSDKSAIRRLDAAVVVSTMQREIFSGLLGPERVRYVPHGIDVHFFTSAQARERNARFRCLFVGSHLRDFDTLQGAIKRLHGKDIEFVIVTSRNEHQRFNGLQNVTLLTGVDDKTLRDLYQTCDLFVVPVLDATANNALLEAMACGAPIVSTDVSGIRDYIAAPAAVLTKKGDPDALAAAIERLFGDDAERAAMGRASREQALLFRWERVAQQLMQLYKELI